MTAPRDYIDFLNDVRSTAMIAQQFVANLSFDEFQADDKTIFAVVRALEIMGEATKRLPQALREENADIPWREMGGIRDRLIHGYENVNVVIVWKAVTEELPLIVPKLDQMLTDQKAGPSEEDRPT